MTNEVEETGDVTVDDVLAAIQQKNIAQARTHFDELMGSKLDNALGAEKIKIADSIFNDAAELRAEEEAESEEHEVETEEETEEETEVDQDFDTIESEIEDAFSQA